MSPKIARLVMESFVRMAAVKGTGQADLTYPAEGLPIDFPAHLNAGNILWS